MQPMECQVTIPLVRVQDLTQQQVQCGMVAPLLESVMPYGILDQCEGCKNNRTLTRRHLANCQWRVGQDPCDPDIFLYWLNHPASLRVQPYSTAPRGQATGLYFDFLRNTFFVTFLDFFFAVFLAVFFVMVFLPGFLVTRFFEAHFAPVDCSSALSSNAVTFCTSLVIPICLYNRCAFFQY